jgi:hypothetical protein
MSKKIAIFVAQLNKVLTKNKVKGKPKRVKI